MYICQSTNHTAQHTHLMVAISGLYFSGIVKTAHSGYPKSFSKDWFTHGYERAKAEETCRQTSANDIRTIKSNKELTSTNKKDALAEIKAQIQARRKAMNPKTKKKMTRFAGLPRGSHLAMTTTVGGHSLLACAWGDKTNKTSIGTSGHILPGKRIQRTTFKAIARPVGSPIQDVRHKTFPIPSVFETLFLNLPKIDIHDHLRQGTLALEKSWATHSWAKRVFSTVLGMSITDAYLAFCFELGPDAKPSFPDWLNRLAFQLIHNDFDTVSLQSPPPGRRAAAPGPRVSTSIPASHEQHALLNICLLDQYKGATNFHFHMLHSTCYTACRPNKSSQTMQREWLHKKN